MPPLNYKLKFKLNSQINQQNCEMYVYACGLQLQCVCTYITCIRFTENASETVINNLRLLLVILIWVRYIPDNAPEAIWEGHAPRPHRCCVFVHMDTRIFTPLPLTPYSHKILFCPLLSHFLDEGLLTYIYGKNMKCAILLFVLSCVFAHME